MIKLPRSITLNLILPSDFKMDTTPWENFCDSCGQFHIVHCESCAEIHCANVCTNTAVNSTPFSQPDIVKLCNICKNHHSVKCTFCTGRHCPSHCSAILNDFQDVPSPSLPTIPTPKPEPPRKQSKLDYKTGKCTICGQVFSYKGSLDMHYQQNHGATAAEPLFFTQQGEGLDNRLRHSHTVLNTVRVYKLDTNNYTYTDVANVFKLIVSELVAIVQTELDEHRCIKIATEMEAHFVRPYLATDVINFEEIEQDDNDLMKHTNPDPVFKAYPHTIRQSHFIPEIINSIAFKLIESVNDFTNKGSGWILDFISKLQFSISPFAPFKAGAYIPNNNLLQFKKKVFCLTLTIV